MICCDRTADAVVMDCGHGGMCYDCSLRLWKKGDECHLCRKPIKEVLQVQKDKDNSDKFLVVSATFMMNDANIERLLTDYETQPNQNENSNSKNKNINISIIELTN